MGFEDNFKGNDKTNQIKFEFDNGFNRENYLINADKTKRGQVVSNLIENSIKFVFDKRVDKERQGIILITIEKKGIN
jgi:nitrogen fixation/metabolism regulation signal transduction histidine kinase